MTKKNIDANLDVKIMNVVWVDHIESAARSCTYEEIASNFELKFSNIFFMNQGLFSNECL